MFTRYNAPPFYMRKTNGEFFFRLLFPTIAVLAGGKQGATVMCPLPALANRSRRGAGIQCERGEVGIVPKEFLTQKVSRPEVVARHTPEARP